MSPYISNKALPHLVSLALIAIHIPYPLYGQQYQQYTYQGDSQDYDAAYDTNYGAQNNAFTAYDNQYDNQADSPANAQADAPAGENAEMQPTEWIGMRPQQDFQQDFAWYGEENWNNANANTYQEAFPCQNPPQECAQECAQNAKQEAETDTCSAPAYCQSTKITKLRPITVVAGLLVVSIVAVALLSNQTHQHTAKSKSHCRSCR